MKTSKNETRIIISVLVAVAIIVAISVFNQQKKAASESTTTVTASESTATIDEEKPGSLYYEETVSFNGDELIKRDIPEWLIDAVSTNDPVIVARTIAERPDQKDFKVRMIFNKDPIGFYCWYGEYISKEGDIISVAYDTYVDLSEPTTDLIVPEEKDFQFVETLINLLWERDRKSFWTKGYEHFVEIKEVPFPSEQEGENCICIDGEFLSIMPDTTTPEPEENPHKYADKRFSRSIVWYSDETFYTVKSRDLMLYKWKWSPNGSKRWEQTGKVPTLPEDLAIATGWNDSVCWYLVEEKGEEGVTVYEPYELPESKAEFGIRPVLEMKFKGVGIARPFVVHEGNEGGWETGYVATPETNTLWKISGHGVYKKELTALEVTGDKVVAQNGQTIEILANRMDDSSYGTWVGYYTGGDYEFQEVVSFEKELEKLKTPGKLKIEGEEIVIEIDDIEITLF